MTARPRQKPVACQAPWPLGCLLLLLFSLQGAAEVISTKEGKGRKRAEAGEKSRSWGPAE